MKFLKRFESQLVLQFESRQKYRKGKDIVIDEIKDYQKKSKYTSVTMSDKLFDKC